MIDCGTGPDATCSVKVDHGTVIELTAATTGHRFAGWGGDCSGKAATCRLTMNGDEGATAEFVPELSVTLTATGPVVFNATAVLDWSSTGASGVSILPDVEDVASPAKGSITVGPLTRTTTYTATAADALEPSRTASASATATVCAVGQVVAAGRCEVPCPAGCTRHAAVGDGPLCRCPGSCPANWARHGNWTATTAATCRGNSDGCGRRRHDLSCTTGSHAFANRAPETCLFEDRDRDWLIRCSHRTLVCRAGIAEAGCVFSPDFGPDPGLTPLAGGASGGGWSPPATGYVLATFECGGQAGACRVHGERIPDGYGTVDVDDTAAARRWECHSDNGTVRACSVPKEDGE